MYTLTNEQTLRVVQRYEQITNRPLQFDFQKHFSDNVEVIQLLNAKIAASQLQQSEVCHEGSYDAVKDAGNL